MLRKIAFITLALLALWGGWLYFKVGTNLDTEVWRLFPNDYIAVIASDEIQLNQSKKSTIALTDWELLASAKKTIELLKLAGDSTAVKEFIGTKKIYYSIHNETASQVNYLVYLPIVANDSKFIEQLSELNSDQLRGTKHKTEGVEIVELVKADTRQRLAFFVQNGIFVMSASVVLIENAAREASRRLPDVQNVPKLNKTHLGSRTVIYLNAANAAGLAKKMMSVASGGEALLGLFPAQTPFSCALDSANRAIVFENSAELQATNPYWQTLQNQKPNIIDALQWIPNTASTYFQISISDPLDFGNRLIRYFDKNKQEYSDTKKSWKSAYGFRSDSLYYFISKHICFYQATNVAGADERVAFFQLSEPASFKNWLSSGSEAIRQGRQVSAFNEKFGEYSIQELYLSEFPATVFGPIFTGFPEKCYFSVFDGYGFIGNSPEAIKSLYEAHQKGEVWRNTTLAQRKLIAMKPASFSLVFDAEKSWKKLIANLNEDWIQPVEKNGESFKKMPYLLWQTNVNPKKIAHILAWQKARNTSDTSQIHKLFLQKSIELPFGKQVGNTPLVFKNSISGNTEILVQTADNELIPMVLGKTPKLKFNLPNKILGKPKWVDFFGKGRDALLLNTGNQVHILHNNSKEYKLYSSNTVPFRIGAGYEAYDNPLDRAENIYISDTQPAFYRVTKKNLQVTLAARNISLGQGFPPFVKLTLRNSDNLVWGDVSGQIAVMTPSGGVLTGFPLNLNQVIDGPVAVEGFGADAQIRVLSKEGLLFMIDMKGKIVERKQLFKPSKESKYKFLIGENGKDWLIHQQTGANVSILDKNLRTLLVVKAITPESEIRFLSFGVAVKVLSVEDSRGTMLYDLRGNKLLDKYLQSDYPVQMEYAESYNKLLLYATTERTVEVWSAKLR